MKGSVIASLRQALLPQFIADSIFRDFSIGIILAENKSPFLRKISTIVAVVAFSHLLQSHFQQSLSWFLVRVSRSFERNRLIRPVVLSGQRRHTSLIESGLDMSNESKETSWNVGDALRTTKDADPWFGIALMYLLTSEQWDALRTGDVFHEIRQKISNLARSRLQGVAGDTSTNVDDAIGATLEKLATRDFLKRFCPGSSRPKSYLTGVMKNYLRENGRAVREVQCHEGDLMFEPTSRESADLNDDRDLSDSLAEVWLLIDALPPTQRQAIVKRFGTSGASGQSRERGTPAEHVARCHGMKKIRDEMHRRRGLES